MKLGAQEVTAYLGDRLVSAQYLGTTPITGGGGRFRVEPVDTNNSWVIFERDNGGAIAHRFIRNNGGSLTTPPNSIGAPYAPWRWAGALALPSFGSSVSAAVGAWSVDEIGAQDYALLLDATDIFGGSFHGGETVISENVTDLANASEGRGFLRLSRTSLIDWGGGVSLLVDYYLTIGRNGVITDRMDFHASHVMDLYYPGMVVGTGAFNQTIIDGIATEVVLDAENDRGSNRLLTLRNASSGRRINYDSDAASTPRFSQRRIQKDWQRAKLYDKIGTGAVDAAVRRTISFEKDADYDYTLNIVGNPSFATGRDGWAFVQGTPVWNAGGFLRMTRTASGERRAVFPIICEVGRDYLFDAAATISTGLGGAYTAIGNSSDGSTSGAVLAVAGGAANARRFTATQIVHYVIIGQTPNSGDVGTTVDWDNVSVRHAAPLDPFRNLVENGTFGAGIDGWTFTLGADKGAWNPAGSLRMTRAASGECRVIYPIDCEVGQTYRFNAAATIAGGLGGERTAIVNSSDGSTTSPVLAVASGAAVNRDFIATQARHYVWLNQLPSSTNVGATVDWDNVSVYRIS